MFHDVLKNIFFSRERSTSVIVLGMHRSGTSCLAGLLEESGVYLGNVSKKNPFNLKGNHENADIVSLNDSVLRYNNSNWHTPPLNNIKWNDEHCDKRDDILNNFKEVDCQCWGFKDPRVVFTLPFWLEEIKNPHFVGTFRHPLSVAQSIHARNNQLSIEYGLQVWLKYNLSLLAFYKKKSFPLISFDVDGEEYLESIQGSLKYLGFSGEDEKSMTFFDEKLRHNKSIDLSYELPSEVKDVYRQLISRYNNPT